MKAPTPDWLSTIRLSEVGVEVPKPAAVTISDASLEVRTPWERDHDRLLFSAPVRRMADKTQVFPLDRNDSVRTRLTHSHEVSNLARSIGLNLIRAHGDLLGFDKRARQAIPAILGAVGLAHDLGNPPFGHQGEVAIGEWFAANKWIFSKVDKTKGASDLKTKIADERDEFLKFEGNAQTLRVLTRLQVTRDSWGLDLTMGTLAALMKYTVPCGGVKKPRPVAANKKYGHFASEADLFKTICRHTGCKRGGRHPLTWLMEACDDIAYSVLDVEDSIKKRLVSYHDLVAAITNAAQESDADGVLKKLLEQMKADTTAVEHGDLTSSERNDVNTQLFRVRAIGLLVTAVVETVGTRWKEIRDGTVTKPVLEIGHGESLVKCLKDFAYRHGYTHPSVLELELMGRAAIMDLMDWFWIGISDRENEAPGSRRRTAFANYIYGEISENYRRIFEKHVPRDAAGNPLPVRYREMRLLTDMISGMTDTYAIETHRRLRPIYADYSRHK